MPRSPAPPRPVLALVATPRFKKEQKAAFSQFIYQHAHTLAKHFKIISTGRTHAQIREFVDKPIGELRAGKALHLVEEDFGRKVPDNAMLKRWRAPINANFFMKKPGLPGLIEVVFELVQGKVDAIIGFSEDDDVMLRAGSAVLRREANVHDVPIASDIPTAEVFMRHWKTRLAALPPGQDARSLFRPRGVKKSPLDGLERHDGDRVLALIAHDGSKTEMCRFLMEHQHQLLRYERILATGHTCELAGKCLLSAGWTTKQVARLRACNSGPKGGDVEIAAAVVQGFCRVVLFFQDPGASHPHASDIQLFEQAVLAGVKVRLATNASTAHLLLEADA